ncbi:unnamed protein product, partial [marine sediment metagenome]
MSGVVNRIFVIPHGVDEKFKPQEEKANGKSESLNSLPSFRTTKRRR